MPSSLTGQKIASLALPAVEAYTQKGHPNGPLHTQDGRLADSDPTDSPDQQFVRGSYSENPSIQPLSLQAPDFVDCPTGLRVPALQQVRSKQLLIDNHPPRAALPWCLPDPYPPIQNR